MPGSSAPAGYRFIGEVIAVAVRWYLRYGLSYRDVEELLAERGLVVDHVTIYRWVQTFTAEFIDAARPTRHARGDRWFVDETYVKVAGRWTYLYRAVDQHGQVIDVLLSERRHGPAAQAFFTRALRFGISAFQTTYLPEYFQALNQTVFTACWFSSLSTICIRLVLPSRMRIRATPSLGAGISTIARWVCCKHC